MAHQVFVSYATEDADAASRVCTLLEADGIQCWVAPRDVKAGTDYAAAIMNAIRSSQLVLLVFSAHSNTSPYALREVERSVAYGRHVLAVRIDDADPTSSMEYYLHEWIEAPGAVENYRTEIVGAVRRQLATPAAAGSGGGIPVSGPRPRGRVQPGAGRAAWARIRDRRTLSVAVAAVIVVAAVGLGLGLGLTRGHAMSGAGPTGKRVAWTRLIPSSTLPSARSAHSMEYDPIRGWLLVFGGSGEKGPLNDTWAYGLTANTWTKLSPTGTLPEARSGHSMAYCPVTRQLLVFGGNDETDVPLDDTWAYDSTGNSWTQLSPLGTPPTARYAYSMVYDPVSRRLIVFGGSGGIGAPLNDTWAYEPMSNTWAQLSPSGTLPAARYSQSMAYDPVSHRLIMFGGLGATGALLNDTWAYDSAANRWTELKPLGTLPPARSGHSMAYDQTSGLLIMFGGQDSAYANLNDTWMYDPVANTWTELKPSGTQPFARAKHAMVYDPTTAGLIMFGGYSRGPDDIYNDTWTCAPGW